MRSDLVHQLQTIVDTSASSDSSRTIARYFLAHLMTLDAMTVQSIAGACYVSIATVSRFVRSLGYDSFAELGQAIVRYRHSINSSVRDYWNELPYDLGGETAVRQYTENIASALQRYEEKVSLEQLDRIAAWIHDAPGVTLYGFFQPGLLAKQLQFLFLSIGRYIEAYDLLEDHEERARTMKMGELAVFFSVDGNYVSGAGRSVIQRLKGTGVGLVLFTQNPSKTLAEPFDEVVLLGEQDSKRAGYYKLQLASELLFSRYMHLYSPDTPRSIGS